MTITIDTIADMLKDKGHAVSKAEGKRIAKAIFGFVATEIKAGNAVQIQDLGSLRVIDKPESDRRNPSTGERFIKPAHKAVKFKASKAMKEAING